MIWLCLCSLWVHREFEQGLTPLMEAAWAGHEIIVETLLACVSVTEHQHPSAVQVDEWYGGSSG